MNRSTEDSSNIEFSSKFFNKITFEKIVNNASATNKENNFLNNNSKLIVKKVKDFGMFGVMNSSNVTKSLLDSDDTNDSKDGMLNKLATAKSAPTTESENDSPCNNEKTKNKNKLKGTNKTVSMKVQGTPGRKGLPLSQAVARRNARERNRVKQVNNGFAALRQCIPDIIAESFESSSNSGNNSRSCAKKLSKVETLRMAVEYIRSLEGLLKQDSNNKPNNANKSIESNLSELNFFVHDDSGCEFKQEIDFDDDDDFLSGTETNEIFEGANRFDPVGDYITEKETLNESSCIQPSFAFVLKDSKLNNSKNANKMHNVLTETMPSNKVKKEPTSAVDEKENENISTSNKNNINMPLKDSFLSPMKSNILQTSSPASSFKKTSKQQNALAINANDTKYQVFIDHLTTHGLATINKDSSKLALYQQTEDYTIKDMIDNELSFGDSVTPKTIRTLFDPDRNLSFYEGMIYFEKESDDFPLKETTTMMSNSKTPSLSEESMIESIDWWESYNCGAMIPDEGAKN